MADIASSSPKTVLIVDAGHGAGRELASLLSSKGLRVFAWATDSAAPEVGDAFRWLQHERADGLAPEFVASLDAVIFNASALDEAALLGKGNLADAIAGDGEFFMRVLQVVSRAMLEKGRGQIWVLAPDDSFSYYLPLPSAPVTHHMRIGAIRSLAKELSRFGVYANAAVLQPRRESAEAAAWQSARNGIGSYAQKFRPVSLAPIVDTLSHWLGCETLPLNGSVIHFGNGVYDGNF